MNVWDCSRTAFAGRAGQGRACGLTPDHAARLVKAGELANVVHCATFDVGSDVSTLFLLSADTTTEDVKQWFMERCAAGTPPSRAEVAERKRQAAGKPPGDRCQLISL